jgi:hypothetical protein
MIEAKEQTRDGLIIEALDLYMNGPLEDDIYDDVVELKQAAMQRYMEDAVADDIADDIVALKRDAWYRERDRLFQLTLEELRKEAE